MSCYIVSINIIDSCPKVEKWISVDKNDIQVNPHYEFTYYYLDDNNIVFHYSLHVDLKLLEKCINIETKNNMIKLLNPIIRKEKLKKLFV